MNLKAFILLTASFLITQACIATSNQEPPLTDPILKSTDGVPGFIDAKKIQNLLWLLQEMKRVHHGFIKVNAEGRPDPSNAGKETDILFKGEKQTLKSLIELEERNQFSAQDKDTFSQLFQLAKDYAEKVNTVLLADAQGTHEFMIKLIKEFCLKRNRPHSELLKWKKGAEIEQYRKNVVSFKTFYIFSSDLMHFIVDLINSCPKAKKMYLDAKDAAATHRMPQGSLDLH